MTTRIYSDNIVDNATAFRGTAATGLPLENVANTQLTKIARITGGSLEIEFPQSTIRCVLLVNHTVSGMLHVDVAKSAAGEAGEERQWTEDVYVGTPAGDEVSAIQFQPHLAYAVRLRFDQTGAVDIGRLFAGVYRSLSKGLALEGFSTELSDDSETQTSVSGQEYTALKEQLTSYSLQWAGLTDDEKDIFSALYRSHGIHTPFFIWVKNYISPPVYAKIDGGFSPEVMAGTRPRLWDLELSLKQQR